MLDVFRIYAVFDRYYSPLELIIELGPVFPRSAQRVATLSLSLSLSVLKERENLGGKRTREASARVNREAQGVIGARLRLVCPGSGCGRPASRPTSTCPDSLPRWMTTDQLSDFEPKHFFASLRSLYQLMPQYWQCGYTSHFDPNYLRTERSVFVFVSLCLWVWVCRASNRRVYQPFRIS